jgi:hypothetical protein
MTLGGKPQLEDIHALGVEPAIIPDPGDAGTIDVSRSGILEITTVGVETRTLPDPTFRGQQLDIVMVVDGGDCVITASSPVNQTGHTTLTLSAVGGFGRYVGKYNATDGWEWQEVVEDTGMASS